MGEILANAGLNTLMGMGVVFVVLILISFVISGFSLINKAEARMKNRGKQPETPAPKAPPAAAQPVVEEDDVTDDTELAAVIAAAIAAYEGTAAEGIVVRSIRKVNSQKTWKRG
ncbi:MAG: OadG family protein [Lachnospiraceae bacterium]|nr:OadG family protein [Lachnospiraceae bacterium]